MYLWKTHDVFVKLFQSTLPREERSESLPSVVEQFQILGRNILHLYQPIDYNTLRRHDLPKSEANGQASSQRSSNG